MNRFVLAFSVLAVFVSDVRAQDFERVLIPVYPRQVSGVSNSSWVANLYGFNESDRFVSVTIVRDGFCLPEGCDKIADPKSPFVLPIENEPNGLLAFVDRNGADQIRFNLQVWDASKPSGLFGAQIPVVREGEFRTGPVRLMNVRVDPLMRTSIRIYELNNIAATVDVDVFDLYGNGIPPVHFQVFLNPQRSDFTARTSFATVSDLLSMIPAEWRAHSLLVEITPSTAGAMIWAFATMTNNSTQAVTVAAPK